MTRMKAEDVVGSTPRPFTGKEYLDSLRDGREVYIYGERVADVTVASGLPQRGPLDRAALRCVARSEDPRTC